MSARTVHHPVFARLYHRVSPKMEREVSQHRAVLLAGLSGRVVEVGAGNGMNFPHYPASVDEVIALEPEPYLRDRASEAAVRAPVPVIVRDGVADALPFAGGEVDAAVASLVLCTVPDQERALAELRRVLKPGGELHFVEHGLAPDESVQRWQHRLDPLQQRVFGGCHLTRPIVDLVRGAGFTIKELDTYYEEGSPKVLGANSLGVAVSP
jgi:ubiquinone/menaquinone biosynthesis C-methylase UbiE